MNTQHDRPSTPPRFRSWECIVGVDRGRVVARTAESYIRCGIGQGALDAIALS